MFRSSKDTTARRGSRAGLVLGALFGAVAFLISSLADRAGQAADPQPPRELGDVKWLRSFEAAQSLAEQESKPIFLLFQEIPGCQTCVSFGQQVLSNPLLVEAIETEFVPVAIYNNRPGADQKVLERFREPAWNNPVVRFVGASGRDLVPRRDGLWRPGEIAQRMTQALAAAGRPAPAYLTGLAAELEPARIERATFSMGCYWAGEACLGELPGLLSSRTGDLGGREVVELRFDPSVTSYAKIVRAARQRGCADGVFASSETQLKIAQAVFGPAASKAPGLAAEASARNQKYHLKRAREIAGLELTPAQAVRINHAVWAKKPWKSLLSPRQQSQLR